MFNRPNVRMTQHYAKVLDQHILKDIQGVE
jgi:hypothetical protein